jgi:hypothetical protein
MLPLTKKQNQLLEVCKQKKKFTYRDIEAQVKFMARKNTYEALEKLEELGFLISEVKTNEETDRQSRYYSYIENNNYKIPTWQEIELSYAELRQLRDKTTPQVSLFDPKLQLYDTNVTKVTDTTNVTNVTKTTTNHIIQNIEKNTPTTLILAFIKARQNDEKPNGSLVAECLAQLGKNHTLLEKLRSQGQIYEARSDHWMVLE